MEIEETKKKIKEKNNKHNKHNKPNTHNTHITKESNDSNNSNNSNKNITNNSNTEQHTLETESLTIQNSNNSSENNIISSNSSENSDDAKKLKILKMMKLLKENNPTPNIIKIEQVNHKNANDYIFEFENKIKITQLNIKNINIPKNMENNITDKNNELLVVYKNEQYMLYLSPDYYNRYEIIVCLNENLKLNDINIYCYLDNQDNFIFKSSDDTIFELIDSKHSILNSLGLINGIYTNEKIYKSNYPIGLSDNILYIKFLNISDEPLFKINNDTNEITNLQKIKFPFMINHLDIKFYFTPIHPILNQKYDFFYKIHNFDIVF